MITNVADDDPQMLSAIQKACQTVQEFMTVLQSPKASQSGLSIKMKITDGDLSEHMWLAPVRYDGKHFHGRINNEPDKVTGVKLGDEKSIEPKGISDWMYVDNGKLVGGYTIRGLHDRMSPAERDRLEKSVPFTFD